MSYWNQFLLSAASIELRWPKLRYIMVAQAILESGRCSTELATTYLNPFGMHYADFNQNLSKKFKYYTDSEPVREDGERWGWFSAYSSYKDAIRGWENWFLNWEHYQKIWKKHPEYLEDPKQFIHAIAPYYCPPGMDDTWIKKHDDLSYPEYILKHLLPEAHKLLKNKSDYITWVELNRADNGDPAITAYAGEKPKFTRFYKNMKEFREFIDEFPSIQDAPLVAETNTKLIPRCPDIKSNKKRILLDPGHSRSEPGAIGASATVKEEILNEIQATVIQKKLEKLGYSVDIENPKIDDLEKIGKKAEGYDAFISLHHNSFSGSGDPYTCALIDNDKAKQSSKQLAALVAKRVSAAIGNPLFQGTHGTPGVYQLGLTVLDRAEQVCKGPCILVESYFLNEYGNMNVATERSKKAAIAISESLFEWFT